MITSNAYRIIQPGLRFLGLALLTWLLCVNATAQSTEKTYRTISGNIGLISVYHDLPVVASSDHLVVTLDYETTDIHFRVDFNTLESTDSLLHFFHGLIPLQLSFKGKLNTDYISTDRHPPLEFDINGIMMLNDLDRKMNIQGKLVSFPQGEVRSRLTINFDLNLRDFDLEERFAGFHHIMKVEIAQAVLVRQ